MHGFPGLIASNKSPHLAFHVDCPTAPRQRPVPAQYLEFLEALKAAGFEGDVDTDHASRTVLATDNSIYQRMPQATIYPRHAEDVARAAQVLARPEFRDVVLTPRGGGTGTNGQSLTHGVTMDLSRHMNGILEINAEQRWVRVQAGVVRTSSTPRSSHTDCSLRPSCPPPTAPPSAA